ncbi:MAG: hypothetical protein MJ065_01115 [Oscillospiraceae bacterium]|nr:hypothetical protein [Oscillospiraceae bacterium]
MKSTNAAVMMLVLDYHQETSNISCGKVHFEVFVSVYLKLKTYYITKIRQYCRCGTM